MQQSAKPKFKIARISRILAKTKFTAMILLLQSVKHKLPSNWEIDVFEFNPRKWYQLSIPLECCRYDLQECDRVPLVNWTSCLDATKTKKECYLSKKKGFFQHK